MTTTTQQHTREASILHKQSKHEIMDIAIQCGGFIAGGAVRSVFASEPINDFDIFFPSKQNFNDCIEKLGEIMENDKNDSSTQSTHFKYNFTKTDAAYSYTTKEKQQFQLIQAVFGSPSDILSSFDFTICMGAWIPNATLPYTSKTFILDDLFLKHIAQHRLVFNANANYPICSLWRALKYVKKGYKLPAVEAIKLALKINSIKIENREDFRKQLMGIDTMFLKELTDALKDNNQPAAPYDFGEAIDLIVKFTEDKEEL